MHTMPPTVTTPDVPKFVPETVRSVPDPEVDPFVGNMLVITGGSYWNISVFKLDCPLTIMLTETVACFGMKAT